MQTQEYDIPTLLCTIIQQLEDLDREQTDNNNLWSTERCARYFSRSKGHFLSLIACKSDFLNLIEVDIKAHPFWIPNEVKQYAKRKQLIQ